MAFDSIFSVPIHNDLKPVVYSAVIWYEMNAMRQFFFLFFFFGKELVLIQNQVMEHCA